jgi:hypothetical protein
MTLAELIRLIESYKRREKERLKEKAMFDYTLSNLIGKSVARIYSSSNSFPEIYEAYPSLFDSEEFEEQKQEQKDILSALRFKQFADAFNRKFKEAAQTE